jgi:hypothetical protein
MAKEVTQDRRRFVRRTNARCGLGDVPQEPELVRKLMQVAIRTVDISLWNLADEGHDGRVHAVGGEKGRSSVQQTGTRHDGKGLRLARRERRAERHITCCLLVPRMQHTQAAPRSVEGVEQRVIV